MGRVYGKRITSYIVFVILAVLVLVCLRPGELFVKNTKSKESIRLRQEQNIYVEETENNIQSSTFVECDVFGIKKLIRDYYDAYLDEDDDEILKYIDTYGDLDVSKRVFARKNVEQYMDIRCYYMEGSIKGAYLVVSYGYAKYYGINTTVPIVDTFFVRMNSSGNYYISNSVVSDESKAYNEIMFEGKQVLEMKSMAEYELNTACEVDALLWEFVQANMDYFIY